ncbi:MAG: hypothetical protein ACYDAN_02270 [Candidatus Limnocylindrales bacterium]
MGARFGFGGHLGAVVAAALLAAGCAGGASSPPQGTGRSAVASVPAAVASLAPTAVATPSAEAMATATPTLAPAGPTASPTAPATPGPIPAKPPVAVLRGLDGPAATGQLGSYTWGRDGSEAPWITGKVLGTAAAGALLDASLGGATPASWTSAWAEVSSGTASSPSDGASGTGRVGVAAPAKAGDWSLRVTATFGPGHNATYFWRLVIK